MRKLIDLITFAKKEREGHNFYTLKYFYGQAYPQYEGTPQIDSPTPNDDYINKMDSNAWWNLKLCASQYWKHYYNALTLDTKGGKKSSAWKWFLREEKSLTASEIMYGNAYSLIETCARRTALHNIMRELMPKTYDTYFK